MIRGSWKTYTGGWTEEDAEILLSIAQRITKRNIVRNGIPTNEFVGAPHPVTAYYPAQHWVATMNL